MSNFKKPIWIAVAIYALALGVAQAQTQPVSPVCIDKAKESAKKMYGNCLADLKTLEMQEAKKDYQMKLQEMQKSYESQLQALRQERAQLRKGIIAQNTQKETDAKAESQSSSNTSTETIQSPTIELKKSPVQSESEFKSSDANYLEIIESNGE